MKLKKLLLKFWLWFFPNIREEYTPNKELSGVKKDKPDNRDYPMEKIIPHEPRKPLFFELPIDQYKYVKSQGKWNSCASHAMATAIEIMHDISETQLNGIELSERYHFYHARDYMDRLPQNVGMTMRDMCKIAQNKGVSPEKLCPYLSSEMNDKPKFMAESFAEWFKVKHYYRVNKDINAIKDVLLELRPVLIGVRVTSSFRRLFRPITVEENEKLYGGHAIIIFGYDDAVEAFKCINSWGVHYKDKGTMLLPYEYILKYFIDAWTISIYNEKNVRKAG